MHRISFSALSLWGLRRMDHTTWHIEEIALLQHNCLLFFPKIFWIDDVSTLADAQAVERQPGSRHIIHAPFLASLSLKNQSVLQIVVRWHCHCLSGTRHAPVDACSNTEFLNG